MTLHMVKLCVGASAIADLEDWRDRSLAEARRLKLPAYMPHVTRMRPARGPELLDGGSLYWVIKGMILARQAIAALTDEQGRDGIVRCRIDLEPEIIPTEPRPRRAFQGWRYLKAEDAPADARAQSGAAPPELTQALCELGLV